jgi:oxygen-independent coproporphyrinogen-3 oxidase
VKLAAIYLHLPFCRNICPFCSFAILKDNQEKHKTYIKLLELEIIQLKQKFNFDCSLCTSIYFGGGTPSCFNQDELAQITGLLSAEFNYPESTQLSIEINPEDVTETYLSQLLELKFKRISLGVQSFNNQALRTLGRKHNAVQSATAVEIVQSCGIENLNLDFMFGFKGQEMDSFTADLEEFIKRSPQHISAYCLNIEQKTAFNRDPSWKSWQSKHEELLFRMYDSLIKRLKNNKIEQYEVSNFAVKGFESLQNLTNWNGKNYLGLGLGAHSFIAPYRWSNHRRWRDYRLSLSRENAPLLSHEKLSKSERFDEELMIQCRLVGGIDLPYFLSKYGVDIQTECSSFLTLSQSQGALIKKSDRYILTTKGLWMADEIASTLASLVDQQCSETKPLSSTISPFS